MCQQKTSKRKKKNENIINTATYISTKQFFFGCNLKWHGCSATPDVTADLIVVKWKKNAQGK